MANAELERRAEPDKNRHYLILMGQSKRIPTVPHFTVYVDLFAFMLQLAGNQPRKRAWRPPEWDHLFSSSPPYFASASVSS